MTIRKNITAPPDWFDAWKSAADAEGLTLSEWIGQRVNSTLPKSTTKKLSQRPPAHRPVQKSKKECG